MTALMRAEARKLLTTQVWFWLLLGAAALAALAVIVPLAQNQPLDPETVHTLFVGGNVSFVAAFVLGVLSVTTEYRYQTITPTLLTTPVRAKVVAAKLVTFVVVGLVFAVVVAAVQAAIALPWLAHKAVAPPGVTAFGRFGVVTALAEIGAVVLMYALVGVGFGALVRNQIVAVVVGLVWVLVLEGLLALIPGVRAVFPYTPGGAARSVLSASIPNPGAPVTLLPWGAGAALLAGWAVVLAGLGVAISVRRDVT